MPIEVYMLALLLPLIGLNCIRNLKLLAPFSTVANVITFLGEFCLKQVIGLESTISNRLPFRNRFHLVLRFGWHPTNLYERANWRAFGILVIFRDNVVRY